MSNILLLLDVFLQSSSEVREPLLAAPRPLPHGELVLDYPRQSAELVHPPWAEPRIVAVERHERALHRVGRLVASRRASRLTRPSRARPAPRCRAVARIPLPPRRHRAPRAGEGAKCGPAP